MSRGSGLFVLLITIALSADSLAADTLANNTLANNTLANNTLAANTSAENKTKCTERHPEYKNAGDEFYKEFYNLVDTRFRVTDPNDTNVDITLLTEKMDDFTRTGIKYCLKDKTDETVQKKNSTSQIYLKTVQYSLRNVTVLKDLQQKGVFKCINQQKINIQTCISDTLSGWTNNSFSKYAHIVTKNFMTFTTFACGQTIRIKNCTLKVLSEHCESGVNYVGGIFDFVINETEKYCDSVNSGSRIAGFLGTCAMFAFWTMIANVLPNHA